MLYLLTGDIQTGKTRWLEGLVADLERAGVPVAGVLAPGVWRKAHPGAPNADAHGFEKLGIDNVLLPGHTRIHLARRRDLARAEGALEAQSQPERAGLGWAMFDAALGAVDAHLAQLSRESPRPGLLVIDELGRLELLRGEGLAHALALLCRGPSAAWPHAVAVVRRALLPAAHDALDAAWAGAVTEIAPTDGARSMIVGSYA